MSDEHWVAVERKGDDVVLSIWSGQQSAGAYLRPAEARRLVQALTEAADRLEAEREKEDHG
jgi:hypothetical protein